MKIFIDSADTDQIKKAAQMGAIDGVTTNPSLLAQVGKTNEQVIPEICEIVDGPVSAEIFALTTEEMVREGRALAKIHPNVVVKVPLVQDGLRAVRRLTADGIKTNVTLCFSPTQALLAAKAGATYISPFVGRLDDVSEDGMGLIEKILRIYRHYDLATEVLVASVRSPEHVVSALLLGADAATVPLSVIEKLARHPLTDLGLSGFMKDADRLQASTRESRR